MTVNQQLNDIENRLAKIEQQHELRVQKATTGNADTVMSTASPVESKDATPPAGELTLEECWDYYMEESGGANTTRRADLYDTCRWFHERMKAVNGVCGPTAEEVLDQVHLRVTIQSESGFVDWYNKKIRPISEVQAEAVEPLKRRLRATTQILIEVIGSPGPENAEDVAARATEEIKRLRAKITDLETHLAESTKIIQKKDAE